MSFLYTCIPPADFPIFCLGSSMGKPAGGIQVPMLDRAQCSWTMVWMVKKCKANPRVPWEPAHSELRKEPPLDGSGRLPLYPFNGQPNPDLIQRLAIKGIWDGRSRLNPLSGGSFRSSEWAHSHGTLALALYFFTIQTILHEHCEYVWSLIEHVI